MPISDKDRGFMAEVADYYDSTITPQEPMGSIRDTALKFGINRNKVRKILITMGRMESPITEIAVRLRKNAQLLLGRNRDRKKDKTPLGHQAERILGDGSCDGLGCQIEELFRKPGTHGFDGREESRDSLSDAGRRFQKELPLPHDRAVDALCQFLLAGTVRKRKLRRLNGSIPRLQVFHLPVFKLDILKAEFVVPITKFLTCIKLGEIAPLSAV